MMTDIVYNYYFKTDDPAQPHTFKALCNALSLVPDNATRVVPPEPKEGTVACWNGSEWILQYDWRQVVLYSTKTGQRVSYPTVNVDERIFECEYTDVAPSSQFDRWDYHNKTWVKDDTVESEYLCSEKTREKKALLEEAKEQIALIEEITYFKDDNDDTTEIDKLYNEWRKYRSHLLVLKIESTTIFPVRPKTVEEVYG